MCCLVLLVLPCLSASLDFLHVINAACSPAPLALVRFHSYRCLGRRKPLACVQASADCLRCLQAVALRPVLHGPSFGSNPNVDRPYIAALVTKALAGPAAAAAASPGVAGSAAQQHADPAAGVSSSSQVPAWSCKAADAAAAVDLQRVLQLSDQLGPHADWVR
jgi:hypothetical protein